MKNKKLFAILTLVCFMFTLMPVAAFAATSGATNDVIEAESSYFTAVDGDQTVKLNSTLVGGTADATEEIEFEVSLWDDTDVDVTATTTGTVYVWAVNENGTVSSALKMAAAYGSESADIANVYELTTAAINSGIIEVQFVRSGEYTVYAGVDMNMKTDVDAVSDLTKLAGEFSVITVKANSVAPDGYAATVAGPELYVENTAVASSAEVEPGVFTNGATPAKNVVLKVMPNNILSEELTVTFRDDVAGKILKNEKVVVETNSSAIEVKAESTTTNARGQIDFQVSASVEGTYEVDFTVDGVTWTLKVQVGNTSAAYIETQNAPKAPQALYGDLGTKVRFEVTDINGNVVTNTYTNGMDFTIANTNDKYIVLTEKPADSDLESSELDLTWNAANNAWALTAGGAAIDLDAEGTYAVKVILENGAYATASWTVKAFDKPVDLKIKNQNAADLATTVEVGTDVRATLWYVDKNGVEKEAKDAVLTATGYAVESLDELADVWTVGVKADEKYAGATINLMAVSEKYDMVKEAAVKVVGEAADIVFADANLEVNVNNEVKWNVVDENGNKVTLSNAYTVENIKYVVLDKPEGAKVSVTDKTAAAFTGAGKMALTSNMVGNVTVQVVVQVELGAGSDQFRYYTGVGVFPVGMDSTGDVVVMSIGSNYIVVNSDIKEIPAAAEVKDARTFVPFRALAEAFGADVEWDAATQSVTAKLNGVTVVLTIGSDKYTVNGVEMTADVAPYIAGDGYTMVPVRFVAEAFGIDVNYTTDENGAVADVLFVM